MSWKVWAGDIVTAEAGDPSDPALREALHEVTNAPGRRLLPGASQPPDRVLRSLLEGPAADDDSRELARRLPVVDLDRDQELWARVLGGWARSDEATWLAQARQALRLAATAHLGEGPWQQALLDAHAPPRAVGIVAGQLVRLALDRAFAPLPPWRVVALRNPVADPKTIFEQVLQAAVKEVGVGASSLREPLMNLQAPFFVLLVTPLPPRRVVDEAARLLPGARFLGLAHPDQLPSDWEPLGLSLPEGGVPFMQRHYQPLADLIEPTLRNTPPRRKAARPRMKK